MARIRTWMVLGRVSNLPTVWSNCLAGWWLGTRTWSREKGPLPLLLLGATLLYLGGMFLNDAFDARFDAQYRRERPIPSGAIPERSVWLGGFLLLVAGLGCLWLLGETVGVLGTMLVFCILAYNAAHKVFTLSPALMAGCRFLLYALAGATVTGTMTGLSVWCGLAMGAYIVGLSYVAGKESTKAAVRYWPCLFLAAPVALALVLNRSEFFMNAALLSIVLVLWVIRNLRFTFGWEQNVGRTVSGLLAGIVLVDLLAVADVPKPFGALFLGLFLLALLLQRFVPAT
jgi:4-hydroxybenzoate polyprenyltransferase